MAIDFAALKSKAGPLPVWVWALLTGLVLALIMFYLRGKSQVNAAQNPNASVSTDPYAAFDNYSAAPTSVTPDANQGASGSYETNQSWIAKAVAWLTSTQNVSGLDAQNALTAYTTGGGALNATQTDIVNRALNQFGLPPEQVYGNPSGTAPTPPNAHPTVQSYIRNPVGSISVVYNNGTKGEFSSLTAYQAFSAKHPAGPYQNVTKEAYASIPTSERNPSW
jgi:hypothetical protein